MTKEKRYKMLCKKMLDYRNGTLKSKKYTDLEIKEKEKYYENCTPDGSHLTKKRWDWEVNRAFENPRMQKCPDFISVRLCTSF